MSFIFLNGVNALPLLMPFSFFFTMQLKIKHQSNSENKIAADVGIRNRGHRMEGAAESNKYLSMMSLIELSLVSVTWWRNGLLHFGHLQQWTFDKIGSKFFQILNKSSKTLSSKTLKNRQIHVFLPNLITLLYWVHDLMFPRSINGRNHEYFIGTLYEWTTSNDWLSKFILDPFCDAWRQTCLQTLWQSIRSTFLLIYQGRLDAAAFSWYLRIVICIWPCSTTIVKVANA